MAKPMISFEEFCVMCNVMNNVSKPEDEPYNKYYVRIKNDFGIERSRSVLQLITRALIVFPDDKEAAYNEYKRLTKERNKKSENNKKKLKQSEQQEFDLEKSHDDEQATSNKAKEEEEVIHHFKVARKATAICAIMLSCEHFSIENGDVTMRMPFHVFINLADHYKGSDE